MSVCFCYCLLFNIFTEKNTVYRLAKEVFSTWRKLRAKLGKIVYPVFPIVFSVYPCLQAEKILFTEPCTLSETVPFLVTFSYIFCKIFSVVFSVLIARSGGMFNMYNTYRSYHVLLTVEFYV